MGSATADGPVAGAAPDGRLHRLLPRGWRGPSRRAAWQRVRARRVAAAVLVGVAAAVVLGALRPTPPPTGVPVVVAARDLPVGTRLGGDDLRLVRWPEGLRPATSLRASGAALGRRLNAPVAAGEPLTASRLDGAGLLAALGAGQVALHLPVRDPAILAYLRPGDRVDAISVADGRVAVGDLLVLSVRQDGVLVALTSEAASLLAPASVDDMPGTGIVLSLHAAG